MLGIVFDFSRYLYHIDKKCYNDTMNARNYSKEMDNIINSLKSKGDEVTPSVLLHSCCAPCSSTCLEQLTPYFAVTVLYYNPNITDKAEYDKRVLEEQKFIENLNNANGFRADAPFHKISFIDGRYAPSEFFDIAKGYEQCPEGGERCFRCYELRLKEAANVAAAGRYDYFTTTLTLSPLKNARKLNEIGEELAKQYNTLFLPSDFKKKNGYKRSIELSKEYDLYRQDYCGCVYSKRRDFVGIQND